MGKNRHSRLYNTRRWKALRAAALSKHPYCQSPLHAGGKTVATVVDHIVPHRGDTRLFFSTNNLQSMCVECHNRFKQSLEKGGAGFNKGCDVSGNPLWET